MGDYKRDSEQDNSMDCPIWGTDDISDEELLKEFEAVKNMAVPSLFHPHPQMNLKKSGQGYRKKGLSQRMYRNPTNRSTPRLSNQGLDGNGWLRLV